MSRALPYLLAPLALFGSQTQAVIWFFISVLLTVAKPSSVRLL